MVAGPGSSGAEDWGLALGISEGAVAISAPVFGAVADRSGRLKPWIAVTTLIAAALIAGLWFVRPQESDVLLALVLVALANFAVELAIVFYNALLPRITPPDMVGRLSGWGWATGYAGGLAALVLCLFLLIKANPPPAFLDVRMAEPVRATAVLTALWLLVFSLPLFLLVREPRRRGLSIGPAIVTGITELKTSLRSVLRHKVLVRFLIARMVYTDGLAALFAFGGLFAAGHFGFRIDEVLILGILLNVTGAIGAAVFGWIDDRINAAYTRLHRLGWAHSVEAWRDGALAGGLYGVAIGGLFAGESMFHRETDASKVALVGLVELLREAPGEPRLVDVQWQTPHLASLGVVQVSRREYLALLPEAVAAVVPRAFA